MNARILTADTHSARFFCADTPAGLEVGLSEEFVLETVSVLRDGDDTLPQTYEELVIPVTGPVAVHGVRAGDVIRIDVLEIELADRGAMITLPGKGAFRDLRTSGLILPVREGAVEFSPGIRVPVVPMLGKIGVGVPGDAPPSSTVGDFGGNMDNKLLGAGTSIHLRAQVDGAWLYAGDLHACQADGESSMTAVEIAGRVTLRVSVVEPWPTSLPVVVTPTHTLVIGSGATLEEAIGEALEGMATIFSAVHGWSRERAAMALSLVGNVGVCQLVNPRVSGKVAVENSYLRPQGER